MWLADKNHPEGQAWKHHGQGWHLDHTGPLMLGSGSLKFCLQCSQVMLIDQKIMLIDQKTQTDWSENSLHPHFLPCLFPHQTLPSMNVIGRTWIYRYFQSWKCKNLIFFPLGKWDLQVGKQILLQRVTVKDKARTKNPLSLELGSWDNWKCYNFILCRISLPRLENSL